MGEMKKIKKSEDDFLELGSSGLNRQSGFIFEEFLKELHGIKGVQTYKEMRDNDSTIGAMLFAIEMLIRQSEVDVEAASDSPEDKAAEEFVESCQCDMENSWDDMMSEVLTMLTFGWAYMETVYKKRSGPITTPTTTNYNGIYVTDVNAPTQYASKYNDGRIGWRKISLRAQETLYQWQFDQEGRVTGMFQQAPPDYRIRFVPMEKALLFRPKMYKSNPEGRSILRNAYRDWYFKKHIENIEGIGIERDLAGLPCAFVPPEILKAECSPQAKATLASIESMVKNVRRDEQEGIVFPLAYDDKGNKLYDFSLLSTGGSRQFDVDKVIARKDRGMAGVVLADFILLGHETVGSKALNSDKTKLFSTAIETWLKSIAEVFNNVAIPKLFSLNTFEVTEYPKIKFGSVEKMDLAMMADFIQKMSASGMNLFPNPDIENFLLREAGLPEVDEDTRAEQMMNPISTQRGMVDQLTSAVAAGDMPKEMAKKIMTKALMLSDEAVEKILG